MIQYRRKLHRLENTFFKVVVMPVLLHLSVHTRVQVFTADAPRAEKGLTNFIVSNKKLSNKILISKSC